MKTFLKYILTFGFFIIIGLFLLDNVFLSIYVNKNKDIYLPDVRNIDYNIAKEKLSNLGFKVEILFSPNEISLFMIFLNPLII